MDNTETQLDPSIVALTKAIGHQESGGDYTKVGDNSHSMGAYQWNNPTPLSPGEIPKNFTSYATEVGANPQDFSPVNQDRVAYKTIQKWGQEGLNPAQIASKWNSGDPNAYQTQQPGYNAQQGVKYDTKSYVDNVSKYYEQYNNQGYNPTPYSSGAVDFSGLTPTTQPKTPDTSTLGGELSQRATEANTAINTLVGGEAQTGQSRLSGLLQLGGAVGGAVGDVTNKALELIPGVKAIENAIGTGVGKLAQTPTGQSVVSSIQSFSQAHPELAKDIGAGFNIITAIPILKGLGAVTGVAKDLVSSPLESLATKNVQGGLEEAATKGGIRARDFFNKNKTIANDMVENRIIPDLGSDGKYDSMTTAFPKTQETIKNAGNQVQQILSGEKYANTGVDSKSILSSVEKSIPNARISDNKILDTVRNLTPENSLLWDKFEAGQANLQEVNKLRSDLDSAVQTAYTSMNEPPFNKKIGVETAGAMRQYVQSTAQETKPLFDTMSKNYRIQKALVFLNGKKPDISSFEKLIKNVPLVGNLSEGMVQGRLAKINRGILSRTGKAAITTPLKSATKKAGLMAGVSVGKKALSTQVQE